MAVTETSISYYGLNYCEHAEKDFAEFFIVAGIVTVIRLLAIRYKIQLPSADRKK